MLGTKGSPPGTALALHTTSSPPGAALTGLCSGLQAAGHYEMLSLPEESISIKVPRGAELIQSPGEA